MHFIFKHKKIIAASIAVVIYFFLTYGVQVQEKAIQKELIQLDKNNDGTYSDDEVTKEQKETIDKVLNDNSRIAAPYTLIPFAFFCGVFVFFGLRALENFNKKDSDK